jgi:transposase
MGRGIILSDRQWDELDQLRFTTASADVFRNGLIVLKADSAETIAPIAEQLGCAAETVKRVRRLYRHGGIEALRPRHSLGRPSKVTPAFLQALRQAVTTSPLTLGYGFSTWSATRLAEHLARQTGIRFSPDQLRRLLHREGFSVQRPKHTMKGRRDKAAFTKAKKQLRRLKKTRTANLTE